MTNETKPNNSMMIFSGGLSPTSPMFDEAYRRDMQWIRATMLAKSNLVPKHFQGQPHNVMIGLDLADSLGLQPFAVLQCLFEVHGELGYESRLIMAAAKKKEIFEAPIRWVLEGQGMDRKCTAYGTLKGTDDERSEEITMQLAKSMGWIDKPGSPWQKMPDLMLKYRSAAWLIKQVAPEILMGMDSKDELEEMQTIEAETTKTTINKPTPIVEQVEQAMKAAMEPAPAPEKKSEPTPKKNGNGKPKKKGKPSKSETIVKPEDLNELTQQLMAQGHIDFPNGLTKILQEKLGRPIELDKVTHGDLEAFFQVLDQEWAEK